QVITTGFMGGIGIIALNAKSYVASIVYYTYLISYAIGVGTKILMGRYAGAGDTEKRKQLYRTSLCMALFANLFFSAVVLILNRPLISIFTESSEIISIVPMVFLVDVAVEAFRAINHVSESSLNANKDVFTTLMASTISCWLGSVLLSYILGIYLGLGLLGCWIAFACDEAIKAIIYIIRWKSGKWLARSTQK
ncbi:MAG: MATE family efflux transporter, partial [Clostridia bacterium]|nr:MATE family efflux transporter [Clostridia bacterium]